MDCPDIKYFVIGGVIIGSGLGYWAWQGTTTVAQVATPQPTQLGRAQPRPTPSIRMPEERLSPGRIDPSPQQGGTASAQGSAFAMSSRDNQGIRVSHATPIQVSELFGPRPRSAGADALLQTQAPLVASGDLTVYELGFVKQGLDD